MKKELATILGLFLVIAVLVVFGGSYSTGGAFKNESTRSAAVANKGVVKVKVGTLEVEAQVAATLDKRQRGLGDRGDLPINQGMLFVFEKQDIYPIWMKNMKFSIDIIWMNESKKVVEIVENAAPELGKKDKELKIYKPSAQAKYILEVNAGLVKLNNTKVGDTAGFDL